LALDEFQASQCQVGDRESVKHEPS
jgi:hypothetical protein